MHESVRGKDEATEVGYLVRGLEALDSVAGVRPVGYRPPSCDMNFRTPDLVARHGFTYCSGMMDLRSSVPLVVRAHRAADALEPRRLEPLQLRAGLCVFAHPAAVGGMRRLGRGARGDRRGRRIVRPDDAPVRQWSTGAPGGAREADRAGAVDGRRLGPATRSPSGSPAWIRFPVTHATEGGSSPDRARPRAGSGGVAEAPEMRGRCPRPPR